MTNQAKDPTTNYASHPSQIMRHLQIGAALLAIAMAVAGCITEGKDRQKTATAAFQPRLVYDASFDKVWKAVNDILDQNRISVVSSDKATGRVQTDKITGPTTSPALLWVQNSRYSYNIRITPDDNGKTKVSILAKLEVSRQHGQTVEPYQDVTLQNQKIVKDYENWLYEQVEKAL
jgi:hypothetical protein